MTRPARRDRKSTRLNSSLPSISYAVFCLKKKNYLGGRFQDRGAGTEAVRLLAGFLFKRRGHHRITIDPAAANEPAIRCYAKVGFRPVGGLLQYKRGPEGPFHCGLLMDLLRDELASNPSPRKRPTRS